MVLCIFGSYFPALRKLLNSACLFISCIFGVWDYFATFSLSCLCVGLNGQVSKKEETKTGNKDYCFANILSLHKQGMPKLEFEDSTITTTNSGAHSDQSFSTTLFRA